MKDIDKIRSIVLENYPKEVSQSYQTKVTDLPYDSGKTFTTADFLKRATHPADRADNGDDLMNIIDNIDDDDEDFKYACSTWKEDLDLEPWESIEEQMGGHASDQEEDYTNHHSTETTGLDSAEFHELVNKFKAAGFSDYMARRKAMQRLGQG